MLTMIAYDATISENCNLDRYWNIIGVFIDHDISVCVASP